MAGVHWNLEKHGGPPHNGVQLASQTDGGGRQWSVVAHTDVGDVPAKCGESGECWYGFEGSEQRASDFSYITHGTDAPMVLVKNDSSGPPEHALRVGHQTDGAGDLYAAVAITEWGTIPGKAKDGTCWFGFCEKEHETTNFYWVCHQPA